MVLSNQLKFIYIGNGKTGSRSIRKSLCRFQEGENFNISESGLYSKGHIPPEALKKLVGLSVWQNSFKFTFVRNSWDWVVSQYFYNFKPDHPIKLSYSDVRTLYEYLKRFRAVESKDSLFQHTYVYDSQGNELLDFVGRYEQLQADFLVISNNLGIMCELPHLNSSDREHDYHQYFTRSGANEVASLYAEDIEYFGYDF